ncbi:hypothetical protein DP032_24495 [Escherichia coli]|nr:hypothetical protein [Escherichia coli]
MLPGNQEDHHSWFKTLLNSSDFACVMRSLRFSDPETSIICSPTTSLNTCSKTFTYLNDSGAYSTLFDHGLAAFFKVVVDFCNKITLCSLFFWIQVDF